MTQVYEYVIIGSGFGGSVSALRSTEKGYSVLVLEKGKRYRDQDFAKTNWQFWKYLWLPAMRAHGILQISLLKGLMVLHGAGVSGWSLGYANVLEIPSAETFATPAWNQPIKRSEALAPHYATARKMLGEVEVIGVRPWTMDDGQRSTAEARYEVVYQPSTSPLKRKYTVRAKSVIFSAGVMGTMQLLLNLRDVKASLPNLSSRLGDMIRTNSEALLGSIARSSEINYSEGISITSIYNPDEITRVEPTRYPDGSSLMRLLAAPLIDASTGSAVRLGFGAGL
jgi:choline dehydrogenase-like flavoprotein